MIRTLITCEFEQKYADQVKYLHIRRAGWAISDIILKPEQLIKEIKKEKILVVLYEQINESVFKKCPNIRMIISSRTDPSANIDITAATKHMIPVFYIIGRNFNFVAEMALGLIFSLARNITLSDRLLRRKRMTSNEKQEYQTDIRWKTSRNDERYKLRGVEIKGKTIGIIGIGNIGNIMAEKCINLGMKVIACDPNINPKNKNIKMVNLNNLLQNSDFISIHTRRTLGLIGLEELNMMKRSAFIINTARGSAIKEGDLIKALKDGIICGAGLDVFEKEPISSDNELLMLDNVVLTPHLAGGGIAEDVISRSSELIIEILNKLRNGKLPENIANPELFNDKKFERNFLDWFYKGSR